MARRTAFDRLLDNLNRPPHDYRRSLEVFPDLDVNKLAEEVDLEAKGKERASEGRKGRVAAFDDIEMQISERIEAEKKSAHAILEDELQTYARRLTGLDIVGRFRALSR